MEKIVQAVKFEGRNIQDIFNLPCVAAIHKSPDCDINIAAVYNSNLKVTEYAHTGDWIALCKNGENSYWRVLSNEQYRVRTEPKVRYKVERKR